MSVDRLLGRDAELASLEGFLERADTGASTLIVEGEPGIGKTTLWQETLRRAKARGFRVLPSRPAEAERALSLAALADLLAGISQDVLSDLAGPRRDALEVVLLQIDPEESPIQARALGAGLQFVLERLSANSPVLLAVDDAQWLDRSSAAALEFALRRLRSRPVSIAVFMRPPRESLRQPLGGLAAEGGVLRLGPLSVAAIHQLVKERLGTSVQRPMLMRMHASSGGNPFYALEIARELRAHELRPGEPLPVPEDLQRLLQRRLRRLSPQARELLLVAATADRPSHACLEAAFDGDSSAAILEAEQAEIGQFRGDRFEFAHPLYSAAVAAGASPEQRRCMHERMAALADDPEERAHHLALAATAPNANVAAALDDAGARALARGAPAVASELTEMALTFTPPADAAGEDRIVRLLELLSLSGDTNRAWKLASDQLALLTQPRWRVRALLILSQLATWTGDWSRDEQHPLRLAERALDAAGDDPALAAECHAVLATLHETEPARASHHASVALELIERGAQVERSTLVLALEAATRTQLFSGGGLDRKQMERAIVLERDVEPAGVADTATFKLAQWLKYVDEFEASRSGLQAAHEVAVDRGDDLSLSNILINRIVLECWAGNWAEARELGERLSELAAQIGGIDPTQHIAFVAALSGDETTVRRLDKPEFESTYDVIRLRSLGLLALSQADFPAAHRYFKRALELLEEAGIREPAVFRIHADAVESAVAVGAIDEGTEAAQQLEEAAAVSEIPWDVMAAARARALLGSAQGRLDQATEDAERALAANTDVAMPFERARTLLVKGQIERRTKRKLAAKASLEGGLVGFEQIGAPLWADRARAEVRRIGLRRGARDELTENERRVAKLAASGLTNKEVAAQLFMSPKTVEANLSRAYRKLNIRSRAELGARLGVPPRTFT